MPTSLESSTDQDLFSDRDSGIVILAPESVMAQQINHDVVDQSQSMGDSLPVDVDANQTTLSTAASGQSASNAQNVATNELADYQVHTVPSESHYPPSTDHLTNGLTSHQTRQADLVRVASSAADTNLTHRVQDNITRAGSIEHDHPSFSKTTEQNALRNSDVGEALSVEEVAAQANALDASGSSDTDTSKADSTEQRDQSAPGHVRSNSVKKPVSFKTVSVTKNFLAKSAVVGQASKTAGDKSKSKDRDFAKVLG